MNISDMQKYRITKIRFIRKIKKRSLAILYLTKTYITVNVKICKLIINNFT